MYTKKELTASLFDYDMLKPSCINDAVSYEDRVAQHKEELAFPQKALNKAIEILTSDEAAATFGLATSMLLQTENAAVKIDGKHASFQAVKVLAHKHHSLRMVAMAAMIQTATEGHFDVVITSVDKMLAELRQERHHPPRLLPCRGGQGGG